MRSVNVTNDKCLSHDTEKDNTPKINRNTFKCHGFNRIFHDKNFTSCGQGVTVFCGK